MAAKIPPQNLEAEQSILGSLMLENEAWDQIADTLDKSDFYKPSHQKIYEIISELHRKNLPVDLITVSNLLQSQGSMEQAGGTDYLVSLVSNTISAANIVSYAKIVREKSLLRKVIHQSSQVIERAYEEDFPDVETFLDQAEADFYKLGENKKVDGLMAPMEIIKNSMVKLEELSRRKSDVTGIPTGFTDLDRMTAGLQPGELTIIAARPSMGKTAFALNLAQHMAIRCQKSVAFFSLEMSRESVMMRVLASEARINMKEMRTGKMNDNVWPKLINVAGQVAEAKFYIDESSGVSPFEVRARARRLKAQVGLDIIIIDYLQLMDLKLRVESRERAVSEISKTLKSIAKELEIPIVALAQLNRGVEGRTNRRPMLSDLRESGSIEQDADIIMMLYRDDYYEKDDAEKQGQAEIIVGKHRNGPTGTVHLRWEAEFGRFRDAEHAPAHPLPPPPQQQPPAGASYGSGKPRNFAPGSDKF